MKPRRKKILLAILVLLIIVQFIPIDRSIPEINPEQDFLKAVNAPQEMASLIKSACYDCHSYHTTYPWYAQIAPVSFFLQGHINGGRDEMNFSEWGTYSKEKAQHKLEECAEMVSEGKMPMKSYTNLHSEARLSDVQKQSLTQWFKQLHQSMAE